MVAGTKLLHIAGSRNDFGLYLTHSGWVFLSLSSVGFTNGYFDLTLRVGCRC